MISVQDVSFSYTGQNTDGIHNINLEIQDGQCVLICGRSGCGKTTVTRLINGLIPYFFSGDLSGKTFVSGREISETPMYEIAETVGSVFQNPRTQFFNVDTDSEIAFGIENAALPFEELHRRVEQTTKDLHIEELRSRDIFALSGGEKQKIAFASVYAMNPDIYLLDEPSSNLDLKTIQELHDHLKLIKEQGKTIVIAEHRIYYLMDLVDRILFMEDGRIAGDFTPEEFKGLPDSVRKQMGLRAIDLMKITPSVALKPHADTILTLNDVSLSYKKQPILEHLNLQAATGEVIGIIGHNGAGKTTFSRGLCGLHKETAGRFEWRGALCPPKSRLQKAYMVMQDVNYELFAESVQAECSFGIQHPNCDLVEQAMRELNLLAYRERHPKTLSGGQKQRAAAAVSMVCQKELLVFDEPTSGLDFDSMLRLAALIRNLAEGGRLVFVVTHDFEFLTQVCNRVLWFGNHCLLDDFDVCRDTLNRLRTSLGLSSASTKEAIV